MKVRDKKRKVVNEYRKRGYGSIVCHKIITTKESVVFRILCPVL